jgi:hypothetical protein
MKPNISKIQLPPSMQKVKASKHRSGELGMVKILITKDGVVPNSKAREWDNYLAKIDDDCQKQKSERLHETLKINGKRHPLPSQFEFCIVDKVPREVLKEYERDCTTGKSEVGLHGGRQHVCVRGLTDPTGKIPPGYVFLTGMANVEFPSFVAVTRFPCTESSDTRCLFVMKERPMPMAEVEWKFLCGLPFGGLIFGRPEPGKVPIPQSVASGDLDGDYYIVR